MFFVFSVAYSFFVYLSYPLVYEWGLFLALQKQEHDFIHFLISISYCMVLVFFAGFLRFGIFSLFNCFLIFTTFIPFFMLMPYFSPGYLYTSGAAVFFFSSLVFTFVGLMIRASVGVGLSVSFNMRSFFYLVLLVNVFSLVAILFNFSGLLSLNAFYDIYGQREAYRSVKGIFSYLLHWQFMVFSPVALIFGMQVRSYFLIFIAIVGFFVVFLITSFKASLVVFLTILLGFFFRGVWGRFATASFVSLALLILFVVSIVIDYSFGVKIISPYIVDRVFFAHGIQLLMITDFFDELPKAMWTNSFLRHFFDPVYSVDPFIYLGQNFFGRDVRLNTNFVGDGFINFGLFGVLLSTLVAAVCLAVCEIVTMKKSFVVCALLFIPHFASLLNGPIQVSLVTNGLLITVAVLLAYPKASIYSDLRASRES